MKKRILVIEHNKDILDLISLVLVDAGYEVVASLNDRDILEQAISIQPDAILLDILKVTDEGTELCRKFKDVHETCHIPVIVLSTHPQIHKVKDVCADDIVEKPFDIDGLLEALEDQLKSSN